MSERGDEPGSSKTKGLLEPDSALRVDPRGADFKLPVCFRGMVDLRRPSFGLHAPMSFCPRGKFDAVLGPVNKGRLVAPFKQLAHRGFPFR